MTDNLFQPPQAGVADPVPPNIQVPEAVAKKIKNCWVAGIVSIAITLILVLLAMWGNLNPAGIDEWAFIDIALMSGFTLGVYKKSRTCAILLLGFFLLNKAVMWADAGQPTGLPLALVFIWYYGRGVVGTFQYHKLVASQSADV